MQLDSIKALLLGILKKYPVAKAAVFGSFARNEANNQSDVDLLIETSRPVTLFDVLRLEKELGEALHRKIDVVEYSALKPSIRQNVLKEAIAIL